MIKELPDHLGGHLNKTHMDRGVFYYVQKKFDIKSMLDIGCGTGGMVEFSRGRGVDAFGIDGDFTLEYHPDLKPYILVHDFVEGPADIWREEGKFDLAWSVEFLEHVEEKYIPHFMSAFTACKYVVVTAAPPGWNGHHHVNLKPQEYWVDVFKEYGFKIDIEETMAIRRESNMMKPFLARTGMFYRRSENE